MAGPPSTAPRAGEASHREGPSCRGEGEGAQPTEVGEGEGRRRGARPPKEGEGLEGLVLPRAAGEEVPATAGLRKRKGNR